MLQTVLEIIERVRNNRSIVSQSESATKQGIILPILRAIGWEPDDVTEVIPEYSVGGGFVDYALCANSGPKVFVEVKRTGIELDQHQEQLLEYSFRQGIELAVLTNGTTWWFYLPLQGGSWDSRKFYAIDIIVQNPSDCAQHFIDFLSKENVISGAAKSSAESILKSRKRKEDLKNSLPKAWKK